MNEKVVFQVIKTAVAISVWIDPLCLELLLPQTIKTHLRSSTADDMLRDVGILSIEYSHAKSLNLESVIFFLERNHRNRYGLIYTYISCCIIVVVSGMIVCLCLNYTKSQHSNQDHNITTPTGVKPCQPAGKVLATSLWCLDSPKQ